jgi:hypothetical protein
MSELIPYLEVTEASYAEHAASTFSVTEATTDVVLLRGACPRCGAALEIPLVPSIFHGMRTINGGGQTNEQVEPMACTCEHEHPNRPEGLTGCGAYWNLTLTEDGS